MSTPLIRFYVTSKSGNIAGGEPNTGTDLRGSQRCSAEKTLLSSVHELITRSRISPQDNGLVQKPNNKR